MAWRYNRLAGPHLESSNFYPEFNQTVWAECLWTTRTAGSNTVPAPEAKPVAEAVPATKSSQVAKALACTLALASETYASSSVDYKQDEPHY